MIRRHVVDGFDTHPDLWIMACDYSTGRRVAFGREGAPEAELPEAVAASCAIPGSYRPVRIGVYSMSNLDVVRDRDLDLAICLNPTSTLDPPLTRNPSGGSPRAGAGSPAVVWVARRSGCAPSGRRLS